MGLKILLMDIDSKIPNLALKKIEKYHLDRGDNVIWNNELFINSVDKAYVSCVFDWNKEKAKYWEGRAEIGGSGYNLDTILPKEIEEVKPRINLGFTTRGCIRKCSFCIVPKKEGMIKAVGDIYDIWDGKSKELIILDNNILALPDHFIKIAQQLIKEKLKVDFNQGLDHRLLTPEICSWLLKLKHIHEIRFAFDDIAYKPTVLKALNMLKTAGMRDWKTRWYVYIGEKDTFDTVFERMKLLQEHKQSVYVMRDRKIYSVPQWIALASWGNTMGAFKMPFEEVINKAKRLKPYKKYFIKQEPK
jgi:hypothetical protein